MTRNVWSFSTETNKDLTNIFKKKKKGKENSFVYSHFFFPQFFHSFSVHTSEFTMCCDQVFCLWVVFLFLPSALFFSLNLPAVEDPGGCESDAGKEREKVEQMKESFFFPLGCGLPSDSSTVWLLYTLQYLTLFSLNTVTVTGDFHYYYIIILRLKPDICSI